jgi:hypothetical protein
LLHDDGLLFIGHVAELLDELVEEVVAVEAGVVLDSRRRQLRGGCTP